jgi:competence protein ComEA
VSFKEQCDKLFFERRHQPAIAVLLLAGLISIGIYILFKRIETGPLVDLDALPPQTAVYQVDLNRAGWPELVVLPGVGEKLAKAIVERRNEIGQFRSTAEIMRIHGIGEGKFAVLKPYLLPIVDSD